MHSDQFPAPIKAAQEDIKMAFTRDGGPAGGPFYGGDSKKDIFMRGNPNGRRFTPAKTNSNSKLDRNHRQAAITRRLNGGKR